jgi:glucose-1-phosphate cytidylyltransferase
MDTLRDRTTLETLWSSGQAPWKMWDELPSVTAATQA